MMKGTETIPYSNVSRLPRYYRFLCELRNKGVSRISSGELARIMGATSSQIRQDFSVFGLSGHQGYGYNVEQTIEQISKVLGLDRPKKAILIGAGNLGRALASFPIDDKGFFICAAFDSDEKLTKKKIGKCPVLHISELESFCRENSPAAAFLCLPEESAPEAVGKLISLGVNCFWNFSHYDIKKEYPGAVVENVHLGDSVMRLSYLMEKTN